MKLIASLGLAASVLLTVSGCSGTNSETEVPLTAEIVAEQLECAPFIEDEPTSPELIKTYTCSSLNGDGPLVFLFEAESNEKLNEWFDSGDLEVGPTDVVYGLDNLALLAMDNGMGIESQLEELFGPPIS